MALCVDRLHYRSLFRCSDWSHRCHISHWVSYRQSSIVRDLGISLAGVEQRCHGLVSSSRKVRRVIGKGKLIVQNSVWYGVQAWIGGECVFLMIASIWPSFGQKSSLTKPIALGATVNYFVSFLLFWLGSLPFIWFPVHRLRHLFTVKSIVSPIGGHCAAHMGPCSSWRHRPRREATRNGNRIRFDLGRHHWYYERDQ